MNLQKEKLLHYIAAQYIVGEDINVSINANDAQIDCLYELLNVSKKLKDALDEQTDYELACVLAKQKKSVAKKFENLTGITWRL
tara:strand:- start:2223 stop:2474 length:252 start_codon:yes stop_codon:yes gene_type:complete